MLFHSDSVLMLFHSDSVLMLFHSDSVLMLFHSDSVLMLFCSTFSHRLEEHSDLTDSSVRHWTRGFDLYGGMLVYFPQKQISVLISLN